MPIHPQFYRRSLKISNQQPAELVQAEMTSTNHLLKNLINYKNMGIKISYIGDNRIILFTTHFPDFSMKLISYITYEGQINKR